MNCSCTDNGQRRSCPIVTLAGYTTFPSLAQHEDTDIRATCFQKVKRALISPQFAPDSMHDWNHAETQASLRQPTHISDNTTTQTTVAPKWAYRHFPSHATLVPQTKQIHVLVGRKRHLVPKASHAHNVLVPEANWNRNTQATQIHLSPSEAEYWSFFPQTTLADWSRSHSHPELFCLLSIAHWFWQPVIPCSHHSSRRSP